MKKLSKKLLAVLLIILMVGVAPSAELANSDLSVFLIQSKADDSIPDGYVGIYTADDLYNIRNNLSGKYILMNDIDLSSYENWTPIGISQNKLFEGVLDGNSYNISNLTINDSSNLEYYGLFGCSKNAIFTNLSLSDVSININSSTTIYVGAICGYFLYDSTVLSGFYVSGEINVKTSGENASVGGIFGDCQGLSYGSVITVEDCIVSANINIDATTVTSGSVIGAVGADVLNFSNCESNGQMFIRSSTKTNAAGNVGYANCSSYISFCINQTNINIIQPQGEINVGGVLGCSFVPLSSTYFSNCGNAGKIIVSSDSDSIVYAGGISGRTGHYLGDTSLIKCYNSAPINISGNSKDSTYFVGGLLGYAKSQGYNNIKIEDSFNCGNINVSDCNTLYVGGMAAYTTSNYTRTARRSYTVGVINYSGCNTVYEDNFYGLSCSYCYYLQDVNMTKQSSATMLTSEQLSNKSYLSTFDFNAVWTYLTDNSFSYSYPTLIQPYFYEYADEQYHHEYNLKNDKYSFVNCFYPDGAADSIDLKYYINMYGSLYGTMLYLANENGEKHGVCYGMASTTAAFISHKDKIETLYTTTDGNFSQIDFLNEITDPFVTYSLWTNTTLEDYIKTAQIYQFYPTNTYQRNKNVDDLEGLIESVKDYVNNDGKPVVIDLYNGSYDNKSNYHTVLAVGISETSKAYNIIIDNPNYYSLTTMSISKDFETWEYAIDLYNNSNGGLTYGCTDVYSLGNSMNITTWSSTALLLKTSAAISSDKSLMSIFSSTGESSTKSGDLLYWTEENVNNISVTTLESGSVFVADYDTGISVNTKTGTEFIFNIDDVDNSVSFDIQKGENINIEFTTVNGNEEINSLAINGVSNGGTVVAAEIQDGIQVTGLNNITVTYETADGTGTTTANITDGRTMNIVVDASNSIDFDWNCSHLCHSTNGFMQFIWKIAKFIYKIFGTNQYCDCGMAHW